MRCLSPMGSRAVSFALLASTFVLLGPACREGGARTELGIESFVASPDAFFPGEGVQLVAVFAGGAGQVDPGALEIHSGVPLQVGPSAAGTTYTLTVTDGTARIVRELRVPFRYRDRVTPLAPLPAARADHAAVLLADRRVMLAGGRSLGSTSHASVTILDPASGTYAPTGDLSTSRDGITGLYFLGGEVVVAGGESNLTDGGERRVERWSPGAGAWTTVGSFAKARGGGTITYLPGGALLAVGGTISNAGAELFTLRDGTSRPTAGAVLAQRHGHTATFVDQVLLVGGSANPGAPPAELYDPETDRFEATGASGARRIGHVAAALRDGRVLVAGGQDPATGATLGSAEVWNPETGDFSPVGALHTPRVNATAIVLVNGEVLVAGGSELVPGDPAPVLRTLASIEIFDPVTNTFRTSAANLPAAVFGHTLTVLTDGRVLVAGGDPGSGYPVDAVAIYD